jgi:hypothetical protein
LEKDSIPKSDLPPSKKIIDVFADFYRYLFQCSKQFIKETQGTKELGETVWDSYESNIDFILSHPNGWGGVQQMALRDAAVKAGLVSNTPEGHEHIHFVSEGEANIHFCVKNNLLSNDIKVSLILLCWTLLSVPHSPRRTS